MLIVAFSSPGTSTTSESTLISTTLHQVTNVWSTTPSGVRFILELPTLDPKSLSHIKHAEITLFL